MNDKKKSIYVGVGIVGVLLTGSFFTWKIMAPQGDLRDEALLALIKNDQPAFARFLNRGGDVHAELPAIDGKTYTIAQGISYFGRASFAKLLQERKVNFIRISKNGEEDILSLAIPKNDPGLLGIFLLDKPELGNKYSTQEYSLLHLASIHCSHRLVSQLNDQGNLRWDQRAKDGSTPLTLAADYECLPVLSYWKEKGADFRSQNGKGQSALSILKKKKSAALVAFAESFESRIPANAPTAAPKEEPNFYKKRKIPKDQIADHTALVEPEARPVEPVETAEMSEFAD